MFKTKKQSLPPFTLQVLTTEYLIEGTVDGKTPLYFPEPEQLDSEPICLTSVQIQPSRLAGIPPRTCTQFEVWGDNAVALIPRVEITRLVDYDAWKEPKIPLRGEFYFGPYLVYGTMMRLRDDSFEKEVPMFDVRITNQNPGAYWGEIQAQFALVHIRWLHGYEPR